jgi:hypothetical protein
MPKTLNTLKKRTKTATGRDHGDMLQNVRREAEYHFDMHKATNGVYTVLQQHMKTF